jgi:AcrR family transcriptional regulator
MPLAGRSVTAGDGTGTARTTRAQYFELGLNLLAGGGARAVTIDTLCTGLEVTKGSFYHHFQGVRDFMAQLLLYWEDRYGHRLAREAVAVKGARAMIPAVKRAASYGVHHEAESAIRALAQSDPFAAEVQKRVDKGREDVLVDMYVDAGMPLDRARTFSRIGMAILVGTQQRERPVDRDRLYGLLDEYQRWIEGDLQ